MAALFAAIPGPIVILIQPPLAKPSEPPAGLAKLSGALATRGIRHTLVDANLEALLYLLSHASFSSPDTWTMRAYRNISRNLASLRDLRLYGNIGRYRRAVADVNRLLERSGGARRRISLADYEESDLSPQKSENLLCAADHPERNIFYPYFSGRLSELMDRGEDHGVVGISLSYLSQAVCAFAMMGFLRRGYPRVKIVLGGSLITSWMTNPQWRNPFRGLVDVLVPGPGEHTLLTMLGERTEKRFFTPSFDDLPLNQYLSPGSILPYAASRGCYWRSCSFCPEKSEGMTFSPTPPALAVENLKQLSSRYEPVLIHLVDDALSPALMARMISDPPGCPWYGFSRMTPELADVEFCKGLKTSGCVMLKLGLESGDQAVLDALEKGITLDLASEALTSLKQAGIATYVYLLFGTPPETFEAARRTLDYVATHHENIDFLNLAIFNLPIDCPEADVLDTRRFYEGDLSLYADFIHPHGWSRRVVRTFLDREFRRHPAVRPILLRHPPFFSSNHAPFFHMQTAR
jgi:hypothetical protein